jgi:hypothetical protein
LIQTAILSTALATSLCDDRAGPGDARRAQRSRARRCKASSAMRACRLRRRCDRVISQGARPCCILLRELRRALRPDAGPCARRAVRNRAVDRR